MSRRIRTVLPVKAEILELHVIPTQNIIKDSVKKNQNKMYYDQMSRSLPPLVVADTLETRSNPAHLGSGLKGPL